MSHPDLTDEQLFWAALRRSPYNGAVSREVHRLRAYTHAEMLAERIDGATQDRIGELLDALERSLRPQVGDVIGPNATDIAWDVLEVRDSQGDFWHRLFAAARLSGTTGELTGEEFEWDWANISLHDGSVCGHATTYGLLVYTPLVVTKVAQRPGGEDA